VRSLRNPSAPWPGQIPKPLPATVPSEPVPVRLVDAAGRPVVVGERGSLDGVPARVEELPKERDDGVASRPGGRPRRITGWAGPWPVHERWWSGTAPRTYLQVVCDDGALLLAGEGPSWWVEGIYD